MIISKTTKHLRPMAVAIAAVFAQSGAALAFEVESGNPDLQIRWDNTVRYNVAQRLGSRAAAIGNSPNYDEGDYLFDKNDLVANRLDVLSEFDLTFQKKLGFRVSAAGWYDAAYGSRGRSNPAVANPSYTNNDFSPYVKRYYHGPSGEFLDAFVFGSFDLGNTPVKLKAGRHTVFWGESLFLGGALHSISYSQMPLDLQKGFATPGAEAKELFRPLSQISAQAQVSDSLSLAAQYFLDWEAYRFPEGGTYLGPADFGFYGPNRVVVTQLPNLGALGPYAGALLGGTRGNPIEPKKNGEFGLSARWSPEVLDGTVGFYYRRYADKLPQVLITQLGATPPALNGVLGGPQPLVNGTNYNLIYADKIDLYGLSLAKNIGGVSVGAEVSYRRNTPLIAKTLGIALGAPNQGDTKGPRGDTYHALVNVLGTISRTPLFDSATWAVELTWSRWDKVRSGTNNFFAVGYAGCSNLANVALGDFAGCATKNYAGLGVSFAPTWFQVVPGVDLSMPVSYSVGLSGNAATTFGGNEGNGSFSIGLGADIHQKYRVDLKYSGYFGRYATGTATGTQPFRVTGCPASATCVAAQSGFTTLLEDRNFVSLTFKTTF
jgi:hypothetical protein